MTGPIIPAALDFLQNGADLSLALKTLKVHVAALSKFSRTTFGRRTFSQKVLNSNGVKRKPSNYAFTTWDLFNKDIKPENVSLGGSCQQVPGSVDCRTLLRYPSRQDGDPALLGWVHAAFTCCLQHGDLGYIVT